MNESHVSALGGDVDDEWTVAPVKDTAEEPANGSANVGHLETEELSLGQQLLQGKWSNRFEDVENSSEDWLVAGLVLKGHMTMLSADPKCGKSTLLNQMYKPLTDVDGGEFLGINVIGNKKIMVISEDNKRIAKRRHDQWNFNLENFHEANNPWDAGSIGVNKWRGIWEDLLKGDLTKHKPYDLVVIDTMSTFAPLRNENDADSVRAVLLPLKKLCASGVAVVIVHHSTKRAGVGARGSGVWTSIPDIIAELKYVTKKMDGNSVKQEDSPQRKLSVKGKEAEHTGPMQLMFDTTTHTYHKYLTDTEKDKLAKASEVLTYIDEHPNCTRPDAAKALGMSESSLVSYCDELYKLNKVEIEGTGRRGNPYIYKAIPRSLNVKSSDAVEDASDALGGANYDEYDDFL